MARQSGPARTAAASVRCSESGCGAGAGQRMVRPRSWPPARRRSSRRLKLLHALELLAVVGEDNVADLQADSIRRAVGRNTGHLNAAARCRPAPGSAAEAARVPPRTGPLRTSTTPSIARMLPLRETGAQDAAAYQATAADAPATTGPRVVR